MKVLTLSEVQASAVGSLGLDPTIVDLSSAEAIACSLRRVAGTLCPCPASTLIEAVCTSLRGILRDASETRHAVEDVLDAIVANGDLFEASNGDQRRVDENSLLYLVPPAFVRRNSGALLLLGVLPDGTMPLPIDLASKVEYEGHLRILPASADANLAELLLELGYFEISSNAWLKTPDPESAFDHVQRFNTLLESAPQHSIFPELQILDAEKPVRYYRDRWTDAEGRSGRFIARRPQAYGSPLWCYTQIHGDLIRLVDMPLRTSFWRGADDALRLQAAIDHERGYPQVFRIRQGPGTAKVLELFSPIPMWARRRCASFGEPISPTGCLISYRFPSDEIEQEIRFLSEYLWLVENN